MRRRRLPQRSRGGASEEGPPEPRGGASPSPSPEAGAGEEGLFAWLTGKVGWIATLLGAWILATAKEQPYLVAMFLWGIVRATGTTVRTGTHGLLFSFGRAVKVIEPGFRPLIPFLQIVQMVPTRSRTLDLPAQRVTTTDGLVYFVDANVVYRVVEVKRAIVQIDDLTKGMRQMLGLSVQEVIRGSQRADLRVSEQLDQRLVAAMEPRLEAWGVAVERAGFMSVRPSPVTLELTQLDRRVRVRREALETMEARGLTRALALPLLGEARQVYSRRGLLRQRADLSRRRRRLQRALAAAQAKHPRLLRRNQKALLRWLQRITDENRDQGLAWARKSMGLTRRSVARRRPGDPRNREKPARDE